MRLETPDEIEILQYSPEPLHFLRFRYAEQLEPQWLLQVNRPDGSLDRATTTEDAMEWVEDEFRVARGEWDVLG